MTQHVLVVDDNLELAENVAELLEASGFVATAVGSPLDALSLAQRQAFDCVVLDVRMPKIDGIELRERMRSCQPRASFVFVTAFAADERLEAAQRSGVVGILAKPFRPESLVALLRVGGGAAS